MQWDPKVECRWIHIVRRSWHHWQPCVGHWDPFLRHISLWFLKKKTRYCVYSSLCLLFRICRHLCAKCWAKCWEKSDRMRAATMTIKCDHCFSEAKSRTEGGVRGMPKGSKYLTFWRPNESQERGWEERESGSRLPTASVKSCLWTLGGLLEALGNWQLLILDL